MTPQEIEALRIEALKDKVEALSDMVEILKAERDALAAQLVSIQDAALKPRGRTRQQWIDNIKRCVLEVSAKECLRDVQAEAGRKGFIECSTRWNLCNAFGEFVLPEEIEAVADEYAATVRQGGAE